MRKYISSLKARGAVSTGRMWKVLVISTGLVVVGFIVAWIAT